MKSRSKELVDRAISAMVSAIEIYNKPGFPYRTESFTILAINAWELLLKAKWLDLNGNKKNCLYVKKPRKNLNGNKSSKLYIIYNRAGTPMTHSLNHLAIELSKMEVLDIRAWDNIQAVMEFRDSAIHFYNQSPDFQIRIQEIGAACTKNFATALMEWFNRKLSEFEMYLMPLAFVDLPHSMKGLMLNPEEKSFLGFIKTLEIPNADPLAPYSVTVNIDVTFTKSKADDSISTKLTKEKEALTIINKEEDIQKKYPWKYDTLIAHLKRRYSNFKLNNQFYAIKKQLEKNDRFAWVRYLDPDNKKGGKKKFYNPNIIKEFDRYYDRIN